jgi:ketosteroid isomerase-like protein
MSNHDPNLDEIIAVERAWVKAHRELDLETISDILSDQYRQIQADGKVIGKAELLESYRSESRHWEVAESDEYEIRLLGNTALLIGRWRGKGQNRGEKFDYTARFLAVYQLEDGQWKLVSDVSVPLKD